MARWAHAGLASLLLASYLTLSGACRWRGEEPTKLREPASTLVDDLALDPIPGSTESGWLAAGHRNEYDILLEAGRFLEIVVEQRGVDLVATLIGPDNEPVIEVDSPNAEVGPESVLAVTGKAGRYELVLHSDDPAAAGAYEIRVVWIGEQTARNAARAAAAGHHWRGEILRQKARRSSESLRGALAEFTTAVELWRGAPDTFHEALTLHRIGQVHERLGEPSDANAAYHEAIRHYKKLGRRREEALLWSRIGNCQTGDGRYQSGLNALHRARTIFAELGDERREASMLNNMALIHDRLGQWQDSLWFFHLALDLWRKLDAVADEAVTLNNLAEVYISLGQLPAARETLAQALELRRQVGDRRGEAKTLNTRGTVFRRTGELERARSDFERSFAVHRELEDLRGMAVSKIGHGLTDVSEKQLDRALTSFHEALRLARQIGERKVEGYALLNLGWVYEGESRSQVALEHFVKARSRLASMGERLGEVSALFGLANVHRDLGQLPEALKSAAEALDHLESLRVAAYSETLGAALVARRYNYYEFYIDLLMELDSKVPEDGYAARALVASERSRARSLLDTLAEAAVDLRRDVDPDLLEEESRIQDELDGKERDRLAALDGPAPAREAIERELRLLAIRYRELEARIRRSSPAYAALTRPRPPKLEEIQELLDGDTVLLEYALGEKRSYLWMVGSNTFGSHTLPAKAKIERLALKAHRLLVKSRGASGQSALELALRTLGDVLLEPVAERLAHSGVKRLVIVTDGALQYVPFAALALPETEGRPASGPLVERFEILTPPSAAVMRTLRLQWATRRTAPRTIAILADPVFSYEDPRCAHCSPPGVGDDGEGNGQVMLPSLPGTLREAEAIAGMVSPPGEAFVASGFDANLELATSGVLAGYRIVHFATHGLVHAEHPELSAVVLSLVDRQGRSRPGHLRAHQIYHLDLPAELVVLSACRTALGSEVRGEGLMSLTRGFMYAGARQVLVSLWNVDDRASAELMQTFYRKLLVEGRKPAAALRLAQEATMNVPRWRAPYFWAGYLLQGDLR